MAEILTLNDNTWQSAVGSKPALIMVGTGEGLRGDFSTAFKKAAAENNTIVFGQLDPTKNPAAAATFNAGDKPVLIGWYRDSEMVRRARPWGTDVVLAIELLEKAFREDAPPPAAANGAAPKPEKAIVDSKPVHVTDVTFQKEVVDYSHKMPVMIDFWADWCQPCHMVAPTVEKMAAEFAGKIRVVKVDIDANPGLHQAFRVMSIPTIMVFKQGQPIFSQAGAFPEPAFRDLIQQVIAFKVPPPQAQPKAAPTQKQPQKN